jgi:polysaccharide pyruvyl transferase WcaK-like protein
MRVHSLSPCIGLGVPMIPLVTQPRMFDFLADVGLGDLAVDAFSEGLEVELVEQCLRVLDDPGERRERFMQARKRMREEARSINSMIFRMFDSE